MKKRMTLRALSLLIGLLSISAAFAAEVTRKFVATDNSGVKYTIEMTYDDDTLGGADVVIYKNSDPSNKVYGSGVGDRETMKYGMFFDSAPFGILFPKGTHRKLQLGNILYMYKKDGKLFIAATDSKDPGMRIPCVEVTEKAQSTQAAQGGDAELTLADFLSDYSYYTISTMLKNKGFSERENEETGETLFKKGDLEVSYSEDFDDSGDGGRFWSITFPDLDDSWNFIQPLQGDSKWKIERAPTGQLCTSADGKITIYRAINMVQIQIGE